MSSMNFTCDGCGREVFGCTFVNGMKFCAKCYQETFGETDKDRKIADLETKLVESESKRKSLEEKIKFLTEETEENFVDGQKYNQLKHQLEKSEKSKESYRLQNEQHHLQLLQFYSRLGVEAFGADIHEKALETLMLMKEELVEKKGLERALSACNRQNDEFAEMIKKLVSEKEELKQQLAEKEKEIENLNNRILISQLQAPEEQRLKIIGSSCCQYNPKQDKISFAIDELEKVKETTECILDNALKISSLNQSYYDRLLDEIDNQIKQLREMSNEK